MSNEVFDIVIIGAGIAGAGVAASLAGRARVALLERESLPGVHSTGRSAAMFFEAYGNDQIRALSRASKPFFVSPPASFATTSLLKPRSSLIVAGQDQHERLDAFRNDPDLSRSCRNVEVSEIVERCPLIDPEKVIGGLLESDSFDIEVYELHQGFLRQMKAAGGTLITSADIRAISRETGYWTLQLEERDIRSPILVNASGAWGDMTAQMAGLSPLGLEPRRRTAILVPAPQGVKIDNLPMVMDIGEQFYFKPDAGQLLVSPADETLTEPCDAQPEELDIAIAVDRMESVVNFGVTRVSHRWAGLRTFAPDRSPVVGFDPRADGFFWLAGQGGYGIQTAPALSDYAACLLMGEDAPQALLDEGLDPARLSPARLLQ